jgi:hypothetical protein
MRVIEFTLRDDDPRQRYDALFEACPRAFIQQSTLWAKAISDIGPDEPIFLLAERDGVPVAGLPLYLFHGPAGSILTSVPQAGPLGGVFVPPGIPAQPAYKALVSEADRIARTRGCIALSVITNPLENDYPVYVCALENTVTLENFTQVLAIPSAVKNGEFVLPNSIEPNISRHVRKCATLGYSVRNAGPANDFDDWYEVHVARHQEIGAIPLNRQLLENIVRILVPANRALFTVVEKDSRITGGCIFVHHSEIADVFILSTSPLARKDGANYLLIKESLCRLEARGAKILNWQSSPRRGDGVYKFKRQWGSEERLYYFVTKLYRDPAELVAFGADRIRACYPGHYVVPFGAIETGFAERNYRKP